MLENVQTQFYRVTYSDDKTQVYNTYDPTLNTTDITGSKSWVDGANVRPGINFTLYRRAGTTGEFVKVDNSTQAVTASTHTWEDMPRTDAAGVEYQYAIAETDAAGNMLSTLTATNNLGSFTVSGGVNDSLTAPTSRLTITNTYASNKAGTAAAAKQWVNGPTQKPDIYLALYRTPAGGLEEPVPTTEAPIRTLSNGAAAASWDNLTQTDKNGNIYTFTVYEVTIATNPAAKLDTNARWSHTVGEMTHTYAVTYSADHLTAINTFMQPESATLEITASKTLSGAALKNEQFTFALSVADSDVNLNAKNDETGAVVFEPISFNKQGDYLITVREVDEKARNYIYDGTTYTILVKVTTDKNNVLQLETTYERDGQPHEGELQFTNTYEKEPSAITSSPIAARVELIGRTLKDREFEFQLRDGADNVMDTVRNGPDGRFSFGTQRFSREGTYVYTIQQVKGTEEGMFYDMEPIRVRITVREGRSGMLEVFMEFLLPTAHATDTGRVLTSGTTYTKAGVDVTSDPLLTNRVGIPPTGDNALTMPLVMMALSLMGLGLWLFSKMRRTDTV